MDEYEKVLQKRMGIQWENQLNFVINNFHFLQNRMTNMDYQQTVENLKVKLSLKKQVWNGVAGSVDQHLNENSSYQPLSWGISVVNKRNRQSKSDANEELFT